MSDDRGVIAGLVCSFCSAKQRDVQRLISGPNVYICDECIGLCVDILVGDKVHRGNLELHGSTQTFAALHARVEATERKEKALRSAANLALKWLFDATKEGRDPITCSWCGEGSVDVSAARDHVGTCEKHPAVIALRALRLA